MICMRAFIRFKKCIVLECANIRRKGEKGKMEDQVKLEDEEKEIEGGVRGGKGGGEEDEEEEMKQK